LWAAVTWQQVRQKWWHRLAIVLIVGSVAYSVLVIFVASRSALIELRPSAVEFLHGAQGKMVPRFSWIQSAGIAGLAGFAVFSLIYAIYRLVLWIAFGRMNSN
jgi:hypothetical protein